MSGPGRFFRILCVPDKSLFVLAGEIDTYVYMLFLRNIIYLVAILMVLNCGVLIPLYATGSTEENCYNNPGNHNKTIYLTQTQQLSLANGIN